MTVREERLISYRTSVPKRYAELMQPDTPPVFDRGVSAGLHRHLRVLLMVEYSEDEYNEVEDEVSIFDPITYEALDELTARISTDFYQILNIEITPACILVNGFKYPPLPSVPSNSMLDTLTELGDALKHDASLISMLNKPNPRLLVLKKV